MNDLVASEPVDPQTAIAVPKPDPESYIGKPFTVTDLSRRPNVAKPSRHGFSHHYTERYEPPTAQAAEEAAAERARRTFLTDAASPSVATRAAHATQAEVERALRRGLEQEFRAFLKAGAVPAEAGSEPAPLPTEYATQSRLDWLVGRGMETLQSALLLSFMRNEPDLQSATGQILQKHTQAMESALVGILSEDEPSPRQDHEALARRAAEGMTSAVKDQLAQLRRAAGAARQSGHSAGLR